MHCGSEGHYAGRGPGRLDRSEHLLVPNLDPRKARRGRASPARQASQLDAERLAEVRKFIERSMTLAGVPGVSVSIYQNGQVVLAEGFGVHELGKPPKVDADTRYLIASNTKTKTTLMLASKLHVHLG
jgi:CubicO group peptidase (beta-lactamase class C family)